MREIINWDSLSEAATVIHEWANNTFPDRGPKSSVNKLGMEELPELLIHLKEHGPSDIGEEWADCVILLLDLARIWNIDPAKAIEAKMRINNNRMWRKDEETGFYNHLTVKQVVDQAAAQEQRKAEEAKYCTRCGFIKGHCLC
jgi:NTP pyrophosphatase (non-canonical NTP hydrolase)